MDPRPHSRPSEAGDVGVRWWVPWLVGLVVTGAVLVALSTVFPVATPVIGGYASLLGAAGQLRGRWRSRARRGHWVVAGLLTGLMTGLGLLLGAASLNISDDQPENGAIGAVVGGALLVISGGALLGALLVARRRRAEVSEDERE